MFAITLCIALLITAAHALINSTSIHNSSYDFTAAIFQPALTGYSSTSFICTGSLISPTAILTLAECVNGLDAANLAVRLGSTPTNYVNKTVSKMTIHPDFSIDSLSGDVAVLHLGSPVKGIKPLEISDASCSESDDRVRLLAWGSTSPTTQSISASLHSLSLYTIPQPICAEQLKSCFNLSNQHFCTQVPRHGGEAYGDFGGPVVGGDGKLIGIISGNPECAASKALALQVNVQMFKGWIEKNLG